MSTTENSIFKDKLKDLNKAPTDIVWTNISSALDKKEASKKRIIPLWVRYGGAVASLLLLLWMGKSFLKTNTSIPQKTTPISTTITPLESKNKQEIQHTNSPTLIVNNDSLKVLPKNNTPKENHITTTKRQYNKPYQKATTIDNTSKTNSLNKKALKNNRTLTSVKKNTDNATENLIAVNSSITNKERQQEKDTDSTLIINNKEAIVLNNITDKKNTKVDSIPIKKSFTLTPNEEGISYDNDAFTKTEENTKKWQVASVVSIHSDLISKSTNMSYGARMGYTIHPKLQIRAGINKVSYSKLDMILYDNNPADIVAGYEEEPTSITYQYAYTEIPLELEYQLLKNRFGVSIIGGVSSLFLDVKDSEITIKNIHLGNLGLGFNYKLSKSFKVQIEPLYKARLNHINTENVNFKTSLWAVSGGLSYRF